MLGTLINSVQWMKKPFQLINNLLFSEHADQAKTISEIIDDKKFWAVHFKNEIEEITNLIRQQLSPPTEVATRLYELQGIISHYTLSPFTYEEEVKLLITYLENEELIPTLSAMERVSERADSPWQPHSAGCFSAAKI